MEIAMRCSRHVLFDLRVSVRGVRALRHAIVLLAVVLAGASSTAHAGFTVCNKSPHTYTYAIIQNFWHMNFQTLMPYSTWRIDGWFQLKPGCTEVIERDDNVTGFLLLQHQVGERWITTSIPERDIRFGNGATGTTRKFCVSKDRFRRWEKTLDELAQCPSHLKAETFSIYFQTNVNTDFTLRLD